MATKKPRITIYLSQEQRDYLEDWADKEKRTLSNLVGVLIDEAIQERQQSPEKTRNSALKEQNDPNHR